jgi:CubicO group peptidase (beta-lactamase class C family)
VLGPIVIATALTAAHGAPAAVPDAALARIVDGVVTPQMQRLSIAGAVVVVVKDGAVALAKGYGFADIAARRPMTADDTLVHVGSISKLFTGIAVMQLVERGVLDLGRDVNEYLDFRIATPPGGVPVTLRLLLTHRAGFEEHGKDLFSRGPAPVPLGTWLERSQPRRLFPGGDVSAYSNYGAALAGYVVERASGVPFAVYVRERILRPLGMDHTTFEQPLPPSLAPLMAKSYRDNNAVALPFVEVIHAAPAGALAATGADMGRFMLALFGGGTLEGQQVLGAATLAQMMAPVVVTPTGSMGLAFFESRVDEQRLIGHDGGTMTFSTRLLLSPEQRLGLFVCYDGGELGGEWNELPRAVLRHYAPVADGAAGSAASDKAAAAAIAGPGAPEDVAVAAGAAGAYQGTRRADSTFARFQALLSQVIIRENGDGTLSAGGVLPFGKARRLRRDQRGTATFHDEKGRALAFTHGPGGAVRLYIGSPSQFWERVPAYLDARVVLPVVGASFLFALGAVLGWPVLRVVRRLRRREAAAPGAGEPPALRRARLIARVVLVIQLTTVAAALGLLLASRRDMTILSDALDPFVVALYAVAWLGVVGSVPAVGVAAWFWNARAGTRAARVHHTAAALAAVVLAWFFFTWRLAGTTLVY